MTQTAGLQGEYKRAFLRFARDGNEAHLHSAYEFGRDAVRRQLNVLELARIHHEALTAALLPASTDADIEQLTKAGADFLAEALSAFEMVYRGYQEVRETALLEKQHADQLGHLANAFIEINSTHSLASLLENATRHAREIVGVDCCVATIPAGHGSRNALWVAAAAESEQAWRDFAGSPEGERLGVLVTSPRSESRPSIMDRRLIPTFKGSKAAWLGVSLAGRDNRALGSLQLFDGSRDSFSDIDRSILVQLAEMTAVALDNVQLYEREHRTAVTLQRALLPDRLPKPERVTVAARYMPGEAGLNVGGDWYDIVELPCDRIMIAIGDVVGRGARAAAVMGRVRTAWRAYALRDDPPEVVTESLNELIQELDPDHFSTMVLVLIDPNQHQLRIVNAGHPPPLLVFPDGSSRYVREGLSVPLGVLPIGGYREETVRLEGGSIVLYTDGLIERGGAPLEEGLRRLQQSAEGASVDAELLCDRILEQMIPNEVADDVALLAVRFSGAGHKD
jgi:Stage II sporulation protein E (SpoIIE)/Phosphoserine phosphatase RsbU, N-terminal domain/GAF domain